MKTNSSQYQGTLKKSICKICRWDAGLIIA